MIYLSLFFISFLAATILPFSSEFTLAGLITTSNYDNVLLLIVASFGNVLGSVINWVLGFYSRNLAIKKWFPFKEVQIERSSKWFNKFICFRQNHFFSLIFHLIKNSNHHR